MVAERISDHASLAGQVGLYMLVPMLPYHVRGAHLFYPLTLLPSS